MPKLRKPADDLNDRNVIATIRYGMEKEGVTVEMLALAMRSSTVTVYARLKNPGSFRLCELRQISKKLRIPLLKLLETQ